MVSSQSLHFALSMIEQSCSFVKKNPCSAFTCEGERQGALPDFINVSFGQKRVGAKTGCAGISAVGTGTSAF
jgi:hypothetical protein